MKTALKVVALAVGLTAVATPALAHGGPGPFAPARAIAGAVLGVGRVVGHVVAPAPAPARAAFVAPAPGPRPVVRAHAPRPVGPVGPGPRILP